MQREHTASAMTMGGRIPLQIKGNYTRPEAPCHSKGRRSSNSGTSRPQRHHHRGRSAHGPLLLRPWDHRYRQFLAFVKAVRAPGDVATVRNVLDAGECEELVHDGAPVRLAAVPGEYGVPGRWTRATFASERAAGGPLSWGRTTTMPATCSTSRSPTTSANAGGGLPQDSLANADISTPTTLCRATVAPDSSRSSSVYQPHHKHTPARSFTAQALHVPTKA